MDLKIISTICALLCTVLVPSHQQKDPHFTNGRSTIVHLFEWKWNDIANECESFLAPNGYGAVQLSPIAENIVIVNNQAVRPWWERYQTISYKFVTRSGNEQELAGMVKRCNAVGVRVFVDVILNHMTGTFNGNNVGTGGSSAQSSNKYYPGVGYDAQHFHQTCAINNYNDAYQLRNCELVGLHDLNQGNDYVRDRMVDMLNRMVDIGIGGFRFDAAKHMLPNDLKVITDRVKNLNTAHGFPAGARPFVYQEVIDYNDGGPVTKNDYTGIGTVTEFSFGKKITEHIQGGSQLKYLKTLGTSWGLLNPDDALLFIDNHDTQREGGVLTYKDAKLYKMAVGFMLAHTYPKFPRVMSSFDFKTSDDHPPQDLNQNIISPQFNGEGACTNGWICEHRWRQIYQMVQFHNIVAGTDMTNWWDNGSNQIAFCRGNKGFVAINKSGDLNQMLQTCLPSGRYCDVISGTLKNGSCTGKVINVDGNGNAQITLNEHEDDGVLTIHIQARLNTSKL